jgi:hypothetical protein
VAEDSIDQGRAGKALEKLVRKSQELKEKP